MFVLRLLLYVALISVAVSFGVYLVTGDRRYLRFFWQLIKFSVTLVLIAGVVFTMGRIILF